MLKSFKAAKPVQTYAKLWQSVSFCHTDWHFTHLSEVRLKHFTGDIIVVTNNQFCVWPPHEAPTEKLNCPIYFAFFVHLFFFIVWHCLWLFGSHSCSWSLSCSSCRSGKTTSSYWVLNSTCKSTVCTSKPHWDDKRLQTLHNFYSHTRLGNTHRHKTSTHTHTDKWWNDQWTTPTPLPLHPTHTYSNQVADAGVSYLATCL